jgi:hypothetical protein
MPKKETYVEFCVINPEADDFGWLSGWEFEGYVLDIGELVTIALSLLKRDIIVLDADCQTANVVLIPRSEM